MNSNYSILFPPFLCLPQSFSVHFYSFRYHFYAASPSVSTLDYSLYLLDIFSWISCVPEKSKSPELFCNLISKELPIFCWLFILRNLEILLTYSFSSSLTEPFFLIFKLFLFLFSFLLLGLHPQHMEVPRLGVKLELQLLAYATATAMSDLSRVCNLHQAHGNTRSLTH